MFAEERQQHILTELAQRGRVEVLELVRALGVSEDTVRRDLRALAARGYLQKTHGGAVSLDPSRMAYSERADLYEGAKARIGERAAELVEAGQSVILDAGSTVLELARRLRVRPLGILTNSLDIAAVFSAEPEVTLSLTGGEWDLSSRYLVGASTLASLNPKSGVSAKAVKLGSPGKSLKTKGFEVSNSTMAMEFSSPKHHPLRS